MTSTVDIKDDSRGRPVQKAKVRLSYEHLLFLVFWGGGRGKTKVRALVMLVFFHMLKFCAVFFGN